MGLLVGLMDIATANNTVAILSLIHIYNNTRQCCIMKQANSFWTLEKNVVIVGKRN